MSKQIKRILVPLNGSEQAELAVQPAVQLAHKFDAVCVLFHAIEAHAKAETHGHAHLADSEHALSYLKSVADRLVEQGVAVETDLHSLPEENIPASIAQHVKELNTDLVVVALHHGGGFHEMLHGNVVQQIIALSEVPVLMFKAERVPSKVLMEGRIIVALDGTPAHEAGMEWAVSLADACQMSIQLLQVVPTSADLTGNRAATRNLLPNATEAALEAATQSAVEYLRQLCQPYRERGIDMRGEVRRGDVVEQISIAANQEHSGLLVLATHGRSAWDAFWSRSQSPQLIANAACPTLLVRVHGEEDER